MAQRVSRRNGRTALDGHKNFGIILLALSLAIACSGLIHLAWAIESQAHDQAPPLDAKSARDDAASSRQYQGTLVPQRGDVNESPSLDDAEDIPEAPESLTDTAPTNANESDAGSYAPASGAPAPTSPSAPATTHVVHHTKYREDVSYRIVHHQASTAHEVVENGRPRIEWTVCPVCMKRHDAAYNERIVDHVNQVLCTACGARHDADYDETVYD